MLILLPNPVATLNHITATYDRVLGELGRPYPECEYEILYLNMDCYGNGNGSCLIPPSLRAHHAMR